MAIHGIDEYSTQFRVAHILDFCTFIIMRHEAATVRVLDFDIVLVTTHTVQLGRRCQRCEELNQRLVLLLGCVRNACDNEGMEGLRRNLLD